MTADDRIPVHPDTLALNPEYAAYLTTSEGNCQGKIDSSQAPVVPLARQHAPIDGNGQTDGKGAAKQSRGRPHDDMADQYDGLLHTYGYHVAGFRAAWTAKGYRTPCVADAAGFPDRFACRESDGRMVAIEFKVPPDELRPEQIVWAQVLQACKVEWYCVTPDDWDTMKEVLL